MASYHWTTREFQQGMTLTSCPLNDIGLHVMGHPVDPSFYVHVIHASRLGNWLLRASVDLLLRFLTSVLVVFLSFFLSFFLMWTFFKVFIGFVTILFLF